MHSLIRIGNAQAFWGDGADAPARLLAQQPNLDYLTLDYLAEVSLSILAIQKDRDPSAGYARDFIEVIRSLIPLWEKGSKVRVVANAGGLNPEGCARACLEVLKNSGCGHLKIGMVTGDDVMPQLKTSSISPLPRGRKRGGGSMGDFNNLETGEPLAGISDHLVTANAYLGARPIAEALKAGADIVITGRVADPSLTVAPCMAHFGWSWDDYHRIAGATVAGHLIECGTQVTGGISTDWLRLPNIHNIGFPVVEVRTDGSCVVTKPPRTGGSVNARTVKEQLLYEIGDPGNYLSPDATVSFLTLSVREAGKDRVLVEDATGRPPPAGYKVSATWRDGFKAHGMLTIFGRDAVKKARLCGEIILQRLRSAGCKPERSLIECLGAGASVRGIEGKIPESEFLETVLRVSVADPRREVVERFSKELASLVTCGPQGGTGYAAGRPKVQPVFGYWPCLIGKQHVKPEVKMLDA